MNMEVKMKLGSIAQVVAAKVFFLIVFYSTSVLIESTQLANSREARRGTTVYDCSSF